MKADSNPMLVSHRLSDCEIETEYKNMKFLNRNSQITQSQLI